MIENSKAIESWQEGSIIDKNGKFKMQYVADNIKNSNDLIVSEEKGKIISENLLKIIDRREAIRRAFEEAREGDLVMITGKGGEQFICSKNNEKIPWDDRLVAKEELGSLLG